MPKQGRGRTSTVMVTNTIGTALTEAADALGNSQASIIRTELAALRNSFPELDEAYRLVAAGEEPHIPAEHQIRQVTAGLSNDMMKTLDFAERLSGIPASGIIRLALLRSELPALTALLPQRPVPPSVDSRLDWDQPYADHETH